MQSRLLPDGRWTSSPQAPFPASNTSKSEGLPARRGSSNPIGRSFTPTLELVACCGRYVFFLVGYLHSSAREQGLPRRYAGGDLVPTREIANCRERFGGS